MEDNKTEPPEYSPLTPEQQHRRRIRSIAIGLGLGALVVIFFLITIIRLGSNVANRPL